MALDLRDGTTRPVFEPVEGLHGLRIAPGGHRMVFRVEEDGVPLSLVVSDLGSTEGRRIAFMTGYPSASLRVVDVETGEIHEIEGSSELEYAQLMDWSSDGAWLAVRESIGRSELWRVPDLLGKR